MLKHTFRSQQLWFNLLIKWIKTRSMERLLLNTIGSSCVKEYIEYIWLYSPFNASDWQINNRHSCFPCVCPFNQPRKIPSEFRLRTAGADARRGQVWTIWLCHTSTKWRRCICIHQSFRTSDVTKLVSHLLHPHLNSRMLCAFKASVRGSKMFSLQSLNHYRESSGLDLRALKYICISHYIETKGFFSNLKSL